MALTGERLPQNRRLRTPAATEWRDGRWVDSGLAHVISSNLSHLQRESVRRWVTSLGPGTVANTTRGYTRSGTGLEDRRDPGSYSGITTIAWDMQTAQRFGPFLLIRDRESSGEAPSWRSVRVSVDADATALTLLVCLAAPNEIPGPNNLGFSSLSITGGRAVYSLDVEVSLDAAQQRCPARRPDGDDPEQSAVTVASLWVGWYSASGTSSIYSITAGEVR